jgi:hypothetical protein
MMNGRVSKIRVMAEYECFPVWIIRGTETLNPPPEDLGVGQDLAADLRRWAADFDSTFNPDDPLSSGFQEANDEEEFNERGRGLAHRVAAAVGSEFQVAYFDLLTGRDVLIS